MLSADDHPGVFTFLVGMIVVVMAAVGLSIMADKHRSFSRGESELHREIHLGASEITELTTRKDESSLRLAEGGGKLRMGSQAHKEVSARLETIHQRQAALEKSRIQLGESIAALDVSFSRYRADYRSKEWELAVGESLDTLTIRGGRDFQQATITRVTDVGLEIRHDHGIARIQAQDLDAKMQDRFQWGDEERRSRLEEERNNREGKSAKEVPAEPDVIANGEAAAQQIAPTPVPQMNRRQKTIPAVDPEKLKLLRLQVSGWSAKVSKLRIDRAEASSRASYRDQSSVPSTGSLETWVARSARLGRELLQAQGALAAARADLATLAPNDPLLRAVEPTP
ncbi:MAG: hypothetical protein V4819_15285 [Verrucomicrobiota bacterium]